MKDNSFETSRRATACGVVTSKQDRVGNESDAGWGIRSGRRFSSRDMCSSEVPISSKKKVNYDLSDSNPSSEDEKRERERDREGNEPGGVSTIK